MATTNSPFKMADDKPLLFEARVQYAEANTDDANLFAGFANALNSADMLVDNFDEIIQLDGTDYIVGGTTRITAPAARNTRAIATAAPPTVCRNSRRFIAPHPEKWCLALLFGLVPSSGLFRVGHRGRGGVGGGRPGRIGV